MKRDNKGRFCKASKVDDLEQVGSCICIALLVLSPAWIIAIVQCMEAS